jgi:hypothetical protein
MSERLVRGIAVGVSAGGIVGMIVSSVLNHNGAAITFGLLTAAAVLCSMVATAVATDTARRLGSAAPASPAVDEETASRVEEMVGQLVAGGADEAALRDLVRQSVLLGRGERPA